MNVRLTETSTQEPGVGYVVEATMSVKARIVIPDLLDDDAPEDDIDGRPRRRPSGPRSRVVFQTAFAGRASASSDSNGRVTFSIDTRNAEDQLIGDLDQVPGASGDIVEYRAVVKVRQPSGARLAEQSRRSTASSFQFSLSIPRRRVVIIDIDGLRWDTLYRHLKRVREAGADLDRRYRFEPRPDASRDTVIGSGRELRSGLGHLCFGAESNMVDVRLARAAFPSYTFPSHATMYTGVGPGAHGITGNQYATRFGSNDLVAHLWEELPRAPSLQGFCTSRTGDLGAGIDWLVGGFDVADDEKCVDRNRGLVSDLFVPTVYERLHDAGRRTCVIHNFFHGARQPWTSEGFDQWWHLSNAEIRTVEDICSDEDVDQYEPFDAASFLKAHLLLRFRPSTIKVEITDRRSGTTRFIPIQGLRADTFSSRLDGTFDEDRFRGEAPALGPPDLMTIYVASVDKASHTEGVANQETYLAWHDNLLAGFLDDYRRLRPFDFNNTVFAIVADHGHRDLVPSDGIGAEVLTALFEAVLDAEPGSLNLVDLLAVRRLVQGRLVTLGEGMNHYVYIDGPADLGDGRRLPSPLEAARLLLATPMRVTPYAALVKDAETGQYLLLPRGDDQPVAIDSPRGREVIAAQLDLPGPDEAELAATEARPGSAATERSLRQRLAGDPVAVLGIENLVAGLTPPPDGPIDRSPDVILLAPEREGFTGSVATHGSFAFPLVRIPMVFCGPAVRDNREIPSAHMVDFSPTILSLLGQAVPDELDGRPLLNFNGRVRRRFDDFDISLPSGSDVTTGDVGRVAPPPAAPSAPVVSTQPPAQAGKPTRPAPSGAFVAIALRGRSRQRELEVVRPSRYRVRSTGYDGAPGYSDAGDDCAQVEVWHIRVRLPHVPGWLRRAVLHALEDEGVVVETEEGQEQLVLGVDALCRLVESTAERLRLAAIERATVSVDATVASAGAGLGLSTGLATAWAEVLESLPREREEPGVAGAPLRAAREVGERLGDLADAALAGAITDAIELPSGPITGESDGERIEAASAVIDQLLGAQHVGEVTGLTWS